MGKTVSDFVIRRLHQWGVRLIYGYPGAGINGLMGVAYPVTTYPRFCQKTASMSLEPSSVPRARASRSSRPR